MGGTAYLKAVGTAIFLALTAYAAAAFTGAAESPRTVTAEEMTLSCSESVTGSVVRDETFVLCSGKAKLSVKDGERVPGGAELANIGRKTLYSPCSGYFSAELNGEAPENAVGRIVTGLTWHYVAQMDASLKSGDSVIIRTEEHSFPAEVESADKNRVIFRCRTGVREVLNISELKADIVFSEKSGFKVPVSALHRDSDGSFVNVLAGKQTERTAVTVTYKADDYYLVSGDIRQGMLIVF